MGAGAGRSAAGTGSLPGAAAHGRGDFAPELDVLAAALEDAVRAGLDATPADTPPPQAP
ncbi:hypothetical protein ACFVT9_07125 [Kitasatospora cineracea]|uniref:hypothetical protein n=1 Tax=Kitasatospora cineracea TaxID=88074 RepID=UPI0036807D3E